MAKQKSRPVRWADAITDCREKMEAISGLASDLADALSELNEVRAEYEDWRDNLPENLQESALGEKLNAIVDMDIESYMGEPLENWSDVESLLDEAEGADLPRGFGRD